MPRLFFLLLFSLILQSGLQAQRVEMVWNDEFDGSSLNREIWTAWSGTAFNNEQQFYTARTRNLDVQNGMLQITGLRENYNNREWTSARIKTQNAVDFRYGTIEIRARVPHGKGMWPAIWMLPTGNEYGPWPYSGEIDIMENRGHQPDRFQQTIHYSAVAHPGSGNALADRRSLGDTFILPDSTSMNEFHTYGFEWTDSTLTWTFDGTEVYRLTRGQIEANAEVYPFDQEFYLILNLAIGGNYLGDEQPDSSTPDTNRMQVDYVRLYQDVNKAPVITTGYPGAVQLSPGTEFEISAGVTDQDGTIDSVAFYINDRWLGTDYEAPYSVPWRADIQGCYTLSIEARDNDNGLSQTSNSGTFIVGDGCTKAAYGDSPIELPGVLELEYFDKGGQDVSYYDSTPDTNLGAAFRPYDAVDITPDTEEPANLLITDLTDGEWTEYTVNVAEDGYYEAELRIKANGNPGRVDLMKGEERLATFNRITQSCGIYNCKNKTGILLEGGEQVLRVETVSDVGSLDQITFTLSRAVSAEGESTLPKQTTIRPNYPNPFNPTTRLEIELPSAGTIDLEVFDSTGRKVQSIFYGRLGAGVHAFTFDGSTLGSGIYFIRMNHPGGTISRPMLLLK